VNDNDVNDMVPILTVPSSGRAKEEKFELTEEMQKESDDEDRFLEVIKRAISIEIRDNIRECMEETQCFVRMWHNLEEGYCDQLECGLRKECETNYLIAKGGWDASTPESKTRSVRRKGPKRKGKKKKQVGKWVGTGKYLRVDYVGSGRPIDVIANTLWEFMGSPEDLPKSWSYPPCISREQREEAKKLFTKEFGSGTRVIKRASYHQYLINGEHLMRLWTSAAGGGWLDLNKELSKIFLRMGIKVLTSTPESGRKTKFRFYPYRIYLTKNRDIDLAKTALEEYKGLDHLKGAID